MVQSLAAAGLTQLSTRDAARQWEQALDDVTAAIAENGTTLDINTEAGRSNQSALDDVAKAAIGQAQAIYDSTQSEEQFRQSLIQSRAGLVASAMQFGLTEDEAGAFADTVLNIPAVKTVNFSTPGLAEAVQNADILRASLAKIGDKTITVQTRYVTSGTPTTNTQRVGTATGSAAGGYIRGPGTTTSDSIPALLSDREYVIRAAAVDRYGVGFFDRVNSMRFADGGLVKDSMVAARAAASVPSTSRAFNFDVKTERTWTPAEALQLIARAEAMYNL